MYQLNPFSSKVGFTSALRILLCWTSLDKLQLPSRLHDYVRGMQETVRPWVQLPNPPSHLREREMHR